MSANASWYDIKAKADTATVRIYNEIGLFGVTAEMFARDLDGVEAKQIDLRLNSPGGQVDEGKAIYNSLLRHPAKVRGTVDGMAASIASVILQAADERVMAEGATMMVHGPYLLAVGNKAVLENAIAYLDTETDAIAEIYAGRSGKSADDWRETMLGETWYGGKEAVEAGLADKVVSQKAQNFTAFNLAKFQNVPAWVASARFDNPDPVVTPRLTDYELQVQALNSMKIPPADKKRALAYLKAR